LVGIRHRYIAKKAERLSGRYSAGSNWSGMAPRPACASEPIANVDRLVVRRIGRRAGPNGLDLQWYWRECIRRSFISRDAQRQLAHVSEFWLALRSTRRGPDYRFGGGARHAPGGIANTHKTSAHRFQVCKGITRSEASKSASLSSFRTQAAADIAKRNTL